MRSSLDALETNKIPCPVTSSSQAGVPIPVNTGSEDTDGIEARMSEMTTLLEHMANANDVESEWNYSGYAAHERQQEEYGGSHSGFFSLTSDDANTSGLHPITNTSCSTALHGTFWDPNNNTQDSHGALSTRTGDTALNNEATSLPGFTFSSRTTQSNVQSPAANQDEVWSAVAPTTPSTADAEAERAWQLLQQLFPGSISLQEAGQSELFFRTGQPHADTHDGVTTSTEKANSFASSPAAAHVAESDHSATHAPWPEAAPSNAPGVREDTKNHHDAAQADRQASGVAFTQTTPMTAAATAHTDAFTHAQDMTTVFHLATLRTLLEQYNTVFYPYPSAEALLDMCEHQQHEQPHPPPHDDDPCITTITAAEQADIAALDFSENPSATSTPVPGSFMVSVGDMNSLVVSSTATPSFTPSTSLPPSITPSPSNTALTASSSITSTTVTESKRRHHTGIKLFLGGLRFEVVQMGRVAICWVLEKVCGVRLDQSNVLIHRKSKSGKHHGVSPTGCASVYVPEGHHAAETLLSMNQRIYCAQDGLYVAPSAEVMRALIASRQLLDVSAEGKVRGPAHPVVVELANSGGGGKGTRSRGGSDAGAARRGRSALSLTSSLMALDSSHTPSGFSPGTTPQGPPSYTESYASMLTPMASLSPTHCHSRTSSQSSALELLGPELAQHHTYQPQPHFGTLANTAATTTTTAATSSANTTQPPLGYRAGVGQTAVLVTPPGLLPASTEPPRHPLDAPQPAPPPTYAAATAPAVSAAFTTPNAVRETSFMGGTAAMPPTYGSAPAAVVPGISPATLNLFPTVSKTSSSPGAIISPTSSHTSARDASHIGSGSSSSDLQRLHAVHPLPSGSTVSIATSSTSQKAAAAVPGLLFHTFPGEERVAREEAQLRRGTPAQTVAASRPAPTHSIRDTQQGGEDTSATVAATTARHECKDGHDGSVALFLGGLAVGATAGYTVWLLSRMGVTVHLSDVTMLPAASALAVAQPSAVVVVASSKDAEGVLGQSRHVLCVPRGCYMAPHLPTTATTPTATPTAATRTPSTHGVPVSDKAVASTSSASAASSPSSPSLPAATGKFHPAPPEAERALTDVPAAIQTVMDTDVELGKLSLFTAVRRQRMPGGAHTRPPPPFATNASGSGSDMATGRSCGQNTAMTLPPPPPPPPPPSYGSMAHSGSPAPMSVAVGGGFHPVPAPASAKSRPPPPPGYNAAVRRQTGHVQSGQLPPPPPPPQYFASTAGHAHTSSSSSTAPFLHTVAGGGAAAAGKPMSSASQAVPLSQFPPPPPPPPVLGGGLSPYAASSAGGGLSPQPVFFINQSYELSPGTHVQFIPVITTTNTNAANPAGMPPPTRMTGPLPPQPPRPPTSAQHTSSQLPSRR